MKNIVKFLSVMTCALLIANVASATSYWVATDKNSDGFGMSVRLVQTATTAPPSTSALGTNLTVSAGPFSSKAEARSNCEKTLKLVRQSATGTSVKNMCTQTINAR